MSSELFKTIEESLNGIGIRGSQIVSKSKSLISNIKSDLMNLMTILKANNSHFIHCVKPNEERNWNTFDETFVSNQLNVMGAAPLLELLRQGFAERLPYDKILSKLLPFISNKAKLFPKDLIGNVLRAIGCETKKFKLGRTQIFFLPNQEQYIDYLSALKDEDAAKLGSQMTKKFFTRQRNVWLIFCRFLGKC